MRNAIKLHKLTLAETLAYRAPNEAMAVLAKAGIRQPRTTQELIDLIDYYILQNEHQALAEFSKIHPDRDLVIQNNAPMQNNNFEGGPWGGDSVNYNNCEGCGGKCGGKKPNYSNVDGDTTPANAPNLKLIGNEQMFYTVTILAMFGLVALMMNKRA